MEIIKLNCYDICPFVDVSSFRPCTEKVAHGYCGDNVASNFNGQVSVQPVKGDSSGQNLTEVTQNKIRIATVKNGQITMTGTPPAQSG